MSEVDKTPSRDRNLADGGVVAVVRPPIVYLVAIAVGLGLEAVWPTQRLPRAVEPLAIALVAFAIALFVAAIRTLRTARTTFRTQQPTTAIVATGPYRFSRNPIYLAFTLLQLGIGLWRNSLWVLALLVPALAMVWIGSVAREERYLEAKFGDEYRRYCAKVRRWL
jgi:protein-S-isoprenylcysteine O-methyltransferase Ste14